MTPEIKLTAERIPLEVLNNGNIALIDQLMAPNFVDHTPQLGVAPTREGLKQSVTALRTAFPDVHYTIEGSVACGDEVVSRLRASGTMTGEFMGIPATGRKATWTEIQHFRIKDGKVVEHWVDVDIFAWFTQLGILPPMG